MEDKEDISKNLESQPSVEIKPLTQYNKSQYPQLLGEVMRVEREAWPVEWQATREKFEARLEVFPEGFFLAFANGQLAGVTTAEIVQFDPKKPPETWDEVTENGYIRKTHNRAGNALYVVSVGVAPEFQGQGIGRELMDAQKQLARNLNLKYLFLGARIPQFSQFHKSYPEVTVGQYVNSEENPGRKLDAEIRFYESCDLKVRKVVPNYGPDPESENFGVIMVWENPDLKK